MSAKPHYLVKTLRDFSKDYSGPLSSLLATAADEIEDLNQRVAVRDGVADRSLAEAIERAELAQRGLPPKTPTHHGMPQRDTRR